VSGMFSLEIMAPYSVRLYGPCHILPQLAG
jgi:hypothetical protein